MLTQLDYYRNFEPYFQNSYGDPNQRSMTTSGAVVPMGPIVQNGIAGTDFEYNKFAIFNPNQVTMLCVCYASHKNNDAFEQAKAKYLVRIKLTGIATSLNEIQRILTCLPRCVSPRAKCSPKASSIRSSSSERNMDVRKWKEQLEEIHPRVIAAPRGK